MTIILEIWPDTGDHLVKQMDFPDDAPDTLILSAVREATVEWLRERKKDAT